MAEEAAHLQIYLPLFRGMKAYWRDLPKLRQSWWTRGKWVAYHGETLIGTSRSGQKLHRKCQKRRIPFDEIYIDRIYDRLQPPWEPESFDGSLIEIDNVENSADAVNSLEHS